jgi:hypothetical protein
MRVALVLSILLLAGCGGGDFEADYATAKSNVAAGAGKAFDDSLGRAVQNEANAHEVLACAAATRDLWGTKYRGVVRFGEGGGFSVEMRPDDAQSKCLVQAYSNESLPEPPSRPYLAPLDFDASPPR